MTGRVHGQPESARSREIGYGWRVYYSDCGTKTYISCCWISPPVLRLGELDWTLRADNSGIGHVAVTI